MDHNYKKYFNYVYAIICVSGTIGLGIDCLVNYLKNEDVSLTEYKKFHHGHPDNVYPSITFCIEHPLLEDKFGNKNGINITAYSQFLKGYYWDGRLLEIDYDNVTVSFNDFLLGARMVLASDYGSPSYYMYSHQETKFPKYKGSRAFSPKFYVSFRFWNKKCFTFDVPYIEQKFMTGFEIYLKNTIFPTGVRPSKPDKDGGFITFFHYPGQWITAAYTNKFEWEEKDKSSPPYTMEFRIQNVQTIQRRNKKKEPCSESMRVFDTMMMDYFMIGVGCRPPHFNTTVNIPLCTKKQEMKILNRQPSLFSLESNYLPCKSIHNLRYDYYENDRPSGK